MIKNFIKTFKDLDKKIKEILVKGLKFSLFISVLGCLLLIYYISFHSSIFLYYIGIKIIWLSVSFLVSFLTCALTMDRIKKEI